MEYYLILFGSAVLVVIAVLSVLLSYMDGKRMRAYLHARAMKKHLDFFVRFIDGQASRQSANPEASARLESLAGRYWALKKNKDALEMIPLANSMVQTHTSPESGFSTMCDEDTRETLIDALEAIGPYRLEYNSNVENFNKLLDKRLQGFLGKLMRMKKLEKLCDLSKLLPGR